MDRIKRYRLHQGQYLKSIKDALCQESGNEFSSLLQSKYLATDLQTDLPCNGWLAIRFAEDRPGALALLAVPNGLSGTESAQAGVPVLLWFDGA
jgi:hypothetical protein